MGRMHNGPNGPISGKFGSLVGYTVNGIGYVKGHYKKRTKPPTEGELLNRKKFAAAQDWIRPIKNILRLGFKGYDPRFQGMAAAKSWLMKHAMRVENGEVIIDPALVKISHGNLPLPENIRCTVEGAQARITWDPGTLHKYSHDQALVLAHTMGNSRACGAASPAFRISGEQTFALDKEPGRIYHIYIGFLAEDRSCQSDSVYLGAFEIGK